MNNDKQLQALQEKCEDLYRKYSDLISKYGRMSKDIAEMQMKFDVVNSASTKRTGARKKDITLYSFNGKILKKRELVLACIKKYVLDYGIIKASEITAAFPDYIQGSLGVIRSVDEIMIKYKSNPKNHFFLEAENLLKFEEGDYAVSKDWTTKNIGRFINSVEKYGFEIKTIER